ncbi:MAG: biotin--[acetyl-CoA-carboxylase] ligase [Clostridia bacterium]|nr:biotin--[acetyl-CoA-carboxylase] ligase [Clostridia bacterium]
MRKEILKTLMENTDKYISGEELSQIFSVSRTAVWKAIKALKEQGYQIESVSRKGYKLIEQTVALSADELAIKIKSEKHSYHFICHKSVDSTSSALKRLANEGVQEWTVVLSEEQLEGRGRLGRQWISKAGEGIYMSLLLKPDILPHHAAKITQIAASAVTLAIRETTNLPVLIKWPNDIVINGKKVCGILTEMAAELNQINYVILGIGINVNGEYFDEEIKDKASSLKMALGQEKPIDRKVVIESFFRHFEGLYEQFIDESDAGHAIEICRKYSAIIGTDVQILRRQNTEAVFVVDLTDEGELLIRHQDGREEVIISGEVSIRRGDRYI